MSALNLSMGSIISLKRLEAAVHREHGKRYPLSEEDKLLELISSAADSNHENVQSSFDVFVKGLNDEEKRSLVYRGVKFDKPVAKETQSDQPVKLKKVVYRGKVTYQEVRSAPNSTDEQGAKKTKRVYRGRVIED